MKGRKEGSVREEVRERECGEEEGGRNGEREREETTEREMTCF